MNVDHLMWSSDYPHSGSDWPNSRVTIERVLRGVPSHMVRQMLHGNCVELYGLDL
jgi:predicted TIM-barrel fold metal-dependent hydrolase